MPKTEQHRHEAERCERLGAAVYDPALTAELLRLAHEHRMLSRARGDRRPLSWRRRP